MAAHQILGPMVGFVGGWIIVRFFFQPVYELFRLRKYDIPNSLIFYVNVHLNPGWGRKEEMDEAQKALRQRASQLMPQANAIRGYRLWQSLKLLPKRTDIKKAENRLIGFSNSIHDGNVEKNRRRLEKIEKLLRIKTGI